MSENSRLLGIKWDCGNHSHELGPVKVGVRGLESSLSPGHGQSRLDGAGGGAGRRQHVCLGEHELLLVLQLLPVAATDRHSDGNL